MDYLWRLLLISVLIAECSSDNRAVTPKSATMQITTTPQCVNCPRKTTTRHTTTHSTSHTNHTTTVPTTAHTNHTTEPPTTTHTNHTTQPPTTAHTNHTTQPPTTAHTNHTTQPPTTAHNTTTVVPTPHTNHTSAPHTSAHTNHTTPHHTTILPPAPPTEYSVNGTSGTCLRIKAIFTLTINTTMIQNYTIPPPPITKASGSCSADTAELVLAFPKGSLSLTFKEEKKNNTYYLTAVNVSTDGKGFSKSLMEMSTPLGHSFACNEVYLEMPLVNIEIKDVKAQAIELKGGNFGPEKNCVISPSRSKTVAIVVGVVLLVLIITVVAAYLIARALRHRSAGYQPL
ncbi:lysosome-associated membrane glycoprotein 1-like [Mantella aurantiaca]